MAEGPQSKAGRPNLRIAKGFLIIGAAGDALKQKARPCVARTGQLLVRRAEGWRTAHAYPITISLRTR
jgi:hypothetical protein